MKPLSLGAVAVLLTFGAPAGATSFARYQEQCVTDPTGRYYVVVKRKDDGQASFPYGPVSLTIAEQRPGSAPVRPARAGSGQGIGDRFAAVDPATCAKE